MGLGNSGRVVQAGLSEGVLKWEKKPTMAEAEGRALWEKGAASTGAPS